MRARLTLLAGLAVAGLGLSSSSSGPSAPLTGRTATTTTHMAHAPTVSSRDPSTGGWTWTFSAPPPSNGCAWSCGKWGDAWDTFWQ
jgi:hypothetical protein